MIRYDRPVETARSGYEDMASRRTPRQPRASRRVFALRRSVAAFFLLTLLAGIAIGTYALTSPHGAHAQGRSSTPSSEGISAPASTFFRTASCWPSPTCAAGGGGRAIAHLKDMIKD